MLGGVKPADLAQGEIIAYPSFDGKMISAIYLKPPVARLGTPPPVVVMAHGGPDWQSFDDFHPMRQSLAEAGFAVLAPNFRGSTGFGRAFLDANRKDWGGGDRKDMIAGVKFLASRGEADPKRAGITGGSYGGYSTLYALARNEGDWAAGVAAYGMPDLALDYELSKSRFATWYETMMGNPKDDAALFKERSAIPSLADLKAPLLVFQGANDTNVPLAEAELVHDRLKKLGRDVIQAVPVGDALLKLRELIIADKVPGIAKQSELFTDPGGHGKPPVMALATYCHFACMYRVNPVCLNDPQPELDRLSRDLKPLLQRVAWEAVLAQPLSGVTGAAAGKPQR